MTKEQFKKFCSFRDEFRKQTALWNEEYNKVLKERIESLSGCEITNSFIYNEKLDEINEVVKKAADGSGLKNVINFED